MNVQRGRFAPPRPEHRINRMIRVPEVRLIDEEGNQLGVVRTEDALTMARERTLDLVEISASARPPVCRLMDYGKFKYEQKKKKNEAKKKMHQVQVKEVRVRPKTGTHDIEVKLRKAREFLEEGDKVNFVVLFKGREIVHAEIGTRILAELADLLQDVGRVERPPRLEGKRMFMTMIPSRK